MALTPKQAGKLARCPNLDEMRSVAFKFDALVDGRIDLRGATVSLGLTGIDLSGFVFEGANLTGSRFVNCNAAGVSFSESVLKNTRITNEAGYKTTWQEADFSRSTIDNGYFGPRTLDLKGAKFCAATIRNTKFMMANLPWCDFSQARLVNVDLRNADLQQAKFINASLESVCLEKASLVDADFSGVALSKMEDWGEPDFSGAKIADAVRYRFAIVKNPLASLTEAISHIAMDTDQRRRATEFAHAVGEFAGGVDEAMIIYDEYEDIIELDLFVQIVKAAKILGMSAT